MTGVYNLTINQGADFRFFMTFKAAGVPVNLTGYSARMQIRAFHSSTEILASPTIALGGALGTVEATLSNEITAALPALAARYDLELVEPGGFVHRPVEGAAIISPEVTK